ncbi:hypothetical protein SH449x_005176 [Pirellulaceae bacterium SH449]
MISRVSFSACCACWFFIALNAVAQVAPQEPERASVQLDDIPTQSIIPYQRVFLPIEVYEQWADDLSEYDPLRREDWQGIFSPLQVDNETAEIFRRAPEISNLYLSARLDGANLVSIASRIRFSRGSLTAETFSLDPWSLAINTNRPGESTLSSRIARTPVDNMWGHDRTGLPVINLQRASIEAAMQPLDLPFPWSMRSLNTSKPTKLEFSFSIPRVSDACLILSLPKQAEIIDSDAPAYKIEDWKTVGKRFGEWGEQADLELNRLNFSGDTRWLIELSGISSCRFTISFDEAPAFGKSVGNSLDYMVLEQNTEHEINPFAIVSNTRLEIGGERTLWDRPLQFALPSTTRIRSLTVAGREVGWRFLDGMVVVTPEELRRIPPTRDATTSLRISYLTLLKDRDSDDVVLPPMTLDKSFVLKGTTSIKRSADQEFAKIQTFAKLRPLERELETVWEWSGYGPEILVSLAPKVKARTARAITKITTRSGVPKVSMRLMIPPHHRMPFSIVLPNEWQGLTVIDTAMSLASGWTVTKERDGERNRFFVLGDSTEISTILDLELQHESQDLLSQIDFDSNWIRIDGESLSNKLVVESLPTDWAIKGLRANETIPVSQLTLDEKAYLGAADSIAVFPLKSASIRVFKNTPKLIANAAIKGGVKRVGTGLVRAEYVIEVDPALNVDQLSLLYESTDATAIAWRMLDKAGNAYTAPVASGAEPIINQVGNAANTVYQIKLPDSNPSLVLSANHPVIDDQVQIAIPRILNGGISSLSLTIDSALEIKQPQRGRWEYDIAGELVYVLKNEDLEHDAQFLELTSAESFRPLSPIKNATPKAHYDMTVDGQGWVSTYWELRFPQAFVGEQRFHVEPGWDIELNHEPAQNDLLAAWIDRSSKEPILSIRMTQVNRATPAARSEESLVLPFVAKRSQALSLPGVFHSLDVSPPVLLTEEGEPLSTRGRVWFPNESRWSAKLNTAVPYISLINRPLSDSLWIWSPWQKLAPSPVDSNGESSNQADRPVNLEVAKLSGLSKDQLSSETTHFFERSQNGWKLVADSSGLASGSPYRFWNVTVQDRWSIFVLCMGVFVGAFVCRLSKWLFLAACVVTIAWLALLGEASAGYGNAIGLAGLWGALIGAALWQIRIAVTRSPTNLVRKSSNSTLWDAAQGSQVEMLNRFIIAGLCSLFLLAGQSRLQAQESMPPLTPSIPKVLIPYAKNPETGEGIVDQVLVPDSLLKKLRGNPGVPYVLKSARHQLKLSARGMTVEGVDQIVSTYEIYAYEPNATIEIPFKPGLQTFSRMLVDGREVAIVPALSPTREYLTWVSDREGMRTIQVYHVPRWVNRPAAAVGTIALDSRDLELAILPAANAVLEVDTDPTVRFDVESQGASLDKESGRYVVHLGAMSSVRGKVRYEPVMSSVLATRSQTDLTFDIELLLQGKTVIARTLLKAGTGSSLDKRITIEADKMWEPVGSSWGNLKLVETRNGRLQYLRRYIFELVPNSSERAESEASIYWALADRSASEASLLFAECVEPFIRPRTLRFARVTRSEWNVEQVTNWTPVLNESESLNWPDLKLIKADQRSTSLRVPQTGGGYLRRTVPNKNLRARVASRWFIDADKQVLTSRVEFFGTSHTDILELELPSGFVLEEATNRNFKVRVYEREENGVRFAQLVAERSNWENYDFTVRLVKRELPTDTVIPIPWLGILNSPMPEQSVELVASNRWRVDLISASATEKVLLGLGEEQGVATLMPGDQMRVTARSPVAKGTVRASQRRNVVDGRFEIVLSGDFAVQPDSVAAIIWEIPSSLANRWRSDTAVATIPCPLNGKAWIKLPLERRFESTANVPFELSFSMTDEEWTQFQEMSDWLRVLNLSEIELENGMAEELSQLEKIAQPSVAKASLEQSRFLWSERNAGANNSENDVYRYWWNQFEPTVIVDLEPSIAVQSVRWNGMPLSHRVESLQLTIYVPPFPSGQWNELEIEVTTDSSTGSEKDSPPIEMHGNDESILEIGLPSSSSVAAMKLSTATETDSGWSHFFQAAKAILSTTKRQIGDRAVAGSDAASHGTFWANRISELARLHAPGLAESEQARMAEIQRELEQFTTVLPSSSSLQISQLGNGRDLEQLSERATETPWQYSWLWTVLPALGVIVVANGKRYPLATLSLLGLVLWMLTGLWILTVLFLLVVLLVGLDTIWLNRSNRRLGRGRAN